MARTLCLDLSTNCGFCIGDVEAEGPPLAFGMWPLPPYATERGRMMARLRNAIHECTEDLWVDSIAIEQRPPASRFAGGTNQNSTDQQTYLEAAVFLACYDLSLPPPKIISPRLARSRVFGSDFTNITQKEKTDGVLVRKLQALGIKVFDHNAADAITIWLLLQQQAMQPATKGKKRSNG